MPDKKGRPGLSTALVPDEIPPLWRTDVTRGLPTADSAQGLEVGFAQGVRWVRPDGKPLRLALRPALRPALRRFGTQEGPRAVPAFVMTEAG